MSCPRAWCVIGINPLGGILYLYIALFIYIYIYPLFIHIIINYKQNHTMHKFNLPTICLEGADSHTHTHVNAYRFWCVLRYHFYFSSPFIFGQDLVTSVCFLFEKSWIMSTKRTRARGHMVCGHPNWSDDDHCKTIHKFKFKEQKKTLPNDE